MEKRSADRRTVWLILLTIIFSAAVLSGAVMYRQQLEADGAKETAIPDGIPKMSWDKTRSEESMLELEAYFYELQPKVAIKNSPDFEWKDICPDHFWVKEFTVTTYKNSPYKVYNFTYIDGAKDNKKMAAAIESEAQDIINIALAKDSDIWNRILTVHDELIRRIYFVSDDNGDGNTRNLYGALVEHRAVCQGYAYAFSYILKNMDIDVSEIYSDEHMWNRVGSLDSGERYIDVTWDDYNNQDSSGRPYIHHDFFCLSKAEMEHFGEHNPEKNIQPKESDPQSAGDNYYTKMGYYIKSGDQMSFNACALQQYQSGKNLLEFRFESPDDYKQAEEWIRSILPALGYSEKYYTYKKDELLTFSAGLYPPADAE